MMRVFLSPFARYSVVLMALVLLAASTPAQRSARKPASQVAAVPTSLSLRTAMDTDNDGKADFTVFRPRDNFWYTFQSSGSFRSIPWGWAGEDMMAPGDYDGDGVGDVAVWRDPEGVWFILNSLDGSVRSQQWGLSGDEPVARDYDGDGKTDLAVIRRSGGIIFSGVRLARYLFSGDWQPISLRPAITTATAHSTSRCIVPD